MEKVHEGKCRPGEFVREWTMIEKAVSSKNTAESTPEPPREVEAEETDVLPEEEAVETK